jgi:hypothetical protein
MAPLASRVIAPTLATAIVGTGLNITINLATEWKVNKWAWMAVCTLTLLAAAVSLWLYWRQVPTAQPQAAQSIRGSYIGGGVTQIRGVKQGGVTIERAAAPSATPGLWTVPRESVAASSEMPAVQEVSNSRIVGHTTQVGNVEGGSVEIKEP